MKPLISVIIPTYNRERYLAEAIESVLEQTFQNFELIVIDDGSTDSTREMIGNYGAKIRYHYQENQGLSSAMNKGIELAQCQHIAFLDSDDLWMQEKLAQQFYTVQQDAKTDMVFGYVQEFLSPELTEENRLKLRCSSNPLPWYATQTMLINRNVFESVGVFNTEVTTGPFVEWYVRAKNHDLNIKMLDTVVCKRRIHLTNYGITHRHDNKEYLKIVEKNLEYLRARKPK